MNALILTVDLLGFWNGFLVKEMDTGPAFCRVTQWNKLQGG